VTDLTVDRIPVVLHQGDLPAGLDLGDAVAVDTETMGLVPHRDRLCLVQIAGVGPSCHLVQMAPSPAASGGFLHAPRLSAVLADPAVTKIFHFARFDVAVLLKSLGVVCRPIYCTKIASRLARTYTDRHGLKDLCRELLGVDLSKEQQSSDWGAPGLSDDQLRYAARDVIYLHRLRDRLETMLEREGRRDLAQACFDFLPRRAELDLVGWPEQDIFAY
jgi:ribonuclease D